VFFQDVLKVVSAILLLYLFLLSIRIVLGWFSRQYGGSGAQGIRGGASLSSLGRPWELLCRFTDPYLGTFYRLRFLRKGIFDFTPIAAILVLVVALDLVNALLSYGRVGVGFFMASVVWAAWSGARFLLLLFLLVGVLRTIPILTRATSGAMMWKVVDLIVQPLVSFVMRVFHTGRRSGYTQYLLLTVGLLFVAWLLGELAVGQLIGFLEGLRV
jgi:YggT family protein